MVPMRFKLRNLPEHVDAPANSTIKLHGIQYRTEMPNLVNAHSKLVGCKICMASITAYVKSCVLIFVEIFASF